MTVAPIGNGMYIGASGDTKPTTGVITGALFLENNTGVISYYNGTTWTAVAGGGGSGEANTAANVGTGAGTIFRDKTSVTLNLKTIKAGTGVTITNNTDDITLDATGAGGGETNTASNFGSSGTGLWKDKNGVDLRFYKIASANNRLTVGLNGTDHMDLTVNEANLSIAYSQLISVPTTIVKTDQTNSFGDFAQTFKDNQLKINNPADTFAYTLVGAAIAAARNITLPLLTGNDTMVTEAFGQTLTTKTIETNNNTIKHSTTNSAGDLMVNNGTKFDRKAKGTALQVLRVNSGATDVEYASLNSENVGTALASGNGSTTTFNIAHGLGSTPYMAFVQCSTHSNTFTFSYDATNITVVFGTAPPSGTNNVKFQWKATL